MIVVIVIVIVILIVILIVIVIVIVIVMVIVTVMVMVMVMVMVIVIVILLSTTKLGSRNFFFNSENFAPDEIQPKSKVVFRGLILPKEISFNLVPFTILMLGLVQGQEHLGTVRPEASVTAAQVV